jgi:ABC-type bacteriocin/lantibiotic exporter with double-glycine peptidase domain
MFKVTTYLKEIHHITSKSNGNILWFPVIFLISAFLEVLSITLLSFYIVMLLSSNLELGKIGVYFLNFFQITEFAEVIKIFGISLVIVFTLKLLFFIFQNFLLFKYSLNLQLILKQKLMHSYLNLNYEEFAGKNTSEYIQTVSGLVNQFAGGTLILVLRTFSDLTIGFGIILFLFIQNSSIMISLLIIFGGISLIYDLVIKRRLREAGIKSSVVNVSVHQNIAEAFRGFKEIRILGVEPYFIKKILEGSRRLIAHQTISQLASIIPRQILEYGLVLFLVLLVVYGAPSSTNQADFLLTLATFSYAGLRLLPIVSSMIVTVGSLRYGRDTVSRLYNSLQSNKKSFEVFNTQTNLSTAKKHFLNLELKNIDFAYRSRDSYVLKNVSLRIDSGDFIGIIGESGSGKSTLVELILGLIKPSAGCIYLNDRAINPKGDELENFWRKQGCYLPQDIFVLDESIEKNISLRDSSFEKDRIKILDAVEKSSLGRFMLKNNLNLSMNIGEGGNKLSGGQRQRVAIARMFYHNRDFLIFDEATSALDSNTQSEIISQIMRMKEKKTIILISHREEVLSECNKIYKIINKSVVEV